MIREAPGQSSPLEAFAAIARALTESLDLAEVLRRIASHGRSLTAADSVTVLRRRNEMAEIVVHAADGDGPGIPVGLRFRPHESLLAELRSRPEPVIVSEVQDSPLIPESVRRRLPIRDLVIVPLAVEGELLGALALGYRQLPEHWALEPTLLRALGDQAAVAIRNAELFESTRRSSEQLAQSRKLSELGGLIARVAHELNKPLTTARLLAEMLETEPLDLTLIEHVRAIGRELEHASAIVRDLLRFSRKPDGAFEPTSLSDVIGDVLTVHQPRIAAVGIRVQVDVPADLPPIFADRRAIRQVLSNLVENAIYAMRDWRGERRIVIRAWTAPEPDPADPSPGPAGADAANAPAEKPGRAPGHVVVTVIDSGPGIAPEVQANLFQPFNTTKPVGEGTGLGLAIVKEIIEEHGGTVAGYSLPNGGAAFRFTVPLAATPPAPWPVPDSPARDTLANDQFAGLHVLVIDDEPGLQRAIRRVLEHFGCSVTIAPTGEEGLQKARDGGFDLILCDVRMPGLDGREIYNRLAAETPNAANRLAFMTGDTVSDEIRRFLTATGRPALSKPFGRAQLASLLRKVTGSGG